jgi:DNA-binding response OmpR family regulator
LARILIIEHDQYLRRMIARALLDAGFEVVSVTDSAPGVRAVYEARPDMVLFDEELPRINGGELCLYISRISDIPVIALVSSEQGLAATRLLEMGADACLAKPPSPEMLLARVNSLFRRYGWSHEDNCWAGIGLDGDECQINLGERTISLTPIEFRLLHCLALNSERIVPYDELVVGVWGSSQISPGNLEFRISSLRKKLAGAYQPGFDIRNLRGVGFRFVKQ